MKRKFLPVLAGAMFAVGLPVAAFACPGGQKTNQQRSTTATISITTDSTQYFTRSFSSFDT
ncbi:hypothetical protein NIES4071_68530 [Calothrix sp. NIES-4071]|nr:hypothetical protein NIES4071_68530 [Calothrix sp. NIES-4071]BAZ61131.1 hypothetical protein NIES4105_68490 [Calothrix sp. NIES-4105]